jgi:SAM-dependent methyltransferase
MLMSLLMRAMQHQVKPRTEISSTSVKATSVPNSSELDRNHNGKSQPDSERGAYVLATGEAAAYRLGLLQRVYGAGTHDLLLNAGVQPGLHALDLGCGVGTVTSLLAEFVGPEGSVVGIDMSAEQLAQAKGRLDRDCTHVRFIQAIATETHLPCASFDVVYCRFLLLHLADPVAALAEMQWLLKPGGLLIIEDGDLTSAGSEPASALNAFAELFGKLGPARGLDYTLGRRLYHLVQAAGFDSVEVSYNQPVIARGAAKRLLELSVAEAGPALVSTRIISASALDRTLLEMRQLGNDDKVLAIMPRMTQVWSRKPREN